MKLIINGRFLTQPVTGVQRYAHEVLSAMDGLLKGARGIDATVLTPRLRGPLPRFQNIRVRSVGVMQGHAWEQLELPFRTERGAVLFCPGNTAPLLSLLAGARVVTTVHDLSYLYFPESYSLAFRTAYHALMPAVLRFSRTVITVSQSERRSIAELYPGARIVAIQNGGLPAHVAVPEATEEQREYVLYVGSLSKRKNFPGLLAVARRLAEEHGIPFVFVGGTSAGLVGGGRGTQEPLIRFAGQVNDTREIAGYFRKAMCCLFPSFYEASPLPPIEAMACGCPVIASDIPSLKERCGDAALYCDPNDTEEMVQAVLRVRNDPGLRRNLRQKGYQRAATFTWEKCAEETLNVLMRAAE